MCTVTFIPGGDGYRIGMNRDERTSRPGASLPAVFEQGSIGSIYPRDVEGGTWIGVNSVGNGFALLNWNDIPTLHAKLRTRGSVIPAVIGSTDPADAQSSLCSLNLQGILPFTLLGFFPKEKVVLVWRWNQGSLQSEVVPWKMRQWCSSSLSDAQASQRRGISLALASRESDTGSSAWLRRLHGSHMPRDRAFSTCVHRGNVETVSYTELTCTDRHIKCEYVVGSPCRVGAVVHCVSIPRTPVAELGVFSLNNS